MPTAPRSPFPLDSYGSSLDCVLDAAIQASLAPGPLADDAPEWAATRLEFTDNGSTERCAEQHGLKVAAQSLLTFISQSRLTQRKQSDNVGSAACLKRHAPQETSLASLVTRSCKQRGLHRRVFADDEGSDEESDAEKKNTQFENIDVKNQSGFCTRLIGRRFRKRRLASCDRLAKRMRQQPTAKEDLATLGLKSSSPATGSSTLAADDPVPTCVLLEQVQANVPPSPPGVISCALASSAQGADDENCKKSDFNESESLTVENKETTARSNVVDASSGLMPKTLGVCNEGQTCQQKPHSKTGQQSPADMEHAGDLDEDKHMQHQRLVCCDFQERNLFLRDRLAARMRTRMRASVQQPNAQEGLATLGLKSSSPLFSSSTLAADDPVPTCAPVEPVQTNMPPSSPCGISCALASAAHVTDDQIHEKFDVHDSESFMSENQETTAGSSVVDQSGDLVRKTLECCTEGQSCQQKVQHSPADKEQTCDLDEDSHTQHQRVIGFQFQNRKLPLRDRLSFGISTLAADDPAPAPAPAPVEQVETNVRPSSPCVASCGLASSVQEPDDQKSPAHEEQACDPDEDKRTQHQLLIGCRFQKKKATFM